MTSPQPDRVRLNGATIVSLESRRQEEMSQLIRKQGGIPVVAPSMREVPLEDQQTALDFAQALIAGDCDVLVLLTGVGLTALMSAMESKFPREQLLDALRSTLLFCRGPKPQAVLKGWGLSATLVAPEPNTTETLLEEIDRAYPSLSDRRVYVQEYGTSAAALAAALQQRGATAHTVPVYAWQLPEDLSPLEQAVRLLARRRCEALIITSAQQLRHLAQVAERMNCWEEVRGALLEHVVVASIGPIASEALLECGIRPDMEPTHPKMGRLVSELASNWAQLAAKNRP